MTIISRRAAMRGIVSTAAATAALAVPAASAATTDVDAVLTAWRAWRPMTEEWKRLDLEVARIKQPDAPWITINGTQFHTMQNLDEDLVRLPEWLKPASEQIRECIIREHSAGWARWEAECERLGLTRRQERMDEIVNLQDPLITIIEDAIGSHPIVVAAKIDIALSEAPDGAEFEDRAWGYFPSVIRGILHELPEDMAQALAPIAAGESDIREVYGPTDVPKMGAAERRAVS